MTPLSGDKAYENEKNHPLIDIMHYDFFNDQHLLFGSTRAASHDVVGDFVGLFKVEIGGSQNLPFNDAKFCKLVPGSIKNSNVTGMYPKLLSDGSGNPRIHFILNYD